LTVEVIVTPWPRYPENGRAPSWEVTVIEPKRVHRGLIWSPRVNRFVKSWASMHLARSAPKAHTEARQFMRDFCSKKPQTGEVQP
jgi:hypothetical protein